MTSEVEAEVAVEAQDAGEAACGETTESPGRPRRRLVDVLILVAAALVAASGLIAWWHTEADDKPDPAATRDAVLIAAKQDIATMNTLDYRDIDGGLARWKSITTGLLHDQLSQVGPEDRRLLADQHKISTGRVVDAGVLELADGSATVIAAVEVSVRDGRKADAQPTVKRNRFSADLVRVGGSWKLESLQQVPVDVS